jgi:hypothetical protein
MDMQNNYTDDYDDDSGFKKLMWFFMPLIINLSISQYFREYVLIMGVKIDGLLKNVIATIMLLLGFFTLGDVFSDIIEEKRESKSVVILYLHIIFSFFVLFWFVCLAYHFMYKKYYYFLVHVLLYVILAFFQFRLYRKLGRL